MKLCWLGCGILAALLALSLLCGMLTQRSTRDAAAALEQALEALRRDETAQAVEGRRAGPAALAAPSPLPLCRTEPRRARRHRAGLCGAAGLFRRGRRSGAAQPLRGLVLLQLQHIAQLDAPYAENFLTCPVRIRRASHSEERSDVGISGKRFRIRRSPPKLRPGSAKLHPKGASSRCAPSRGHAITRPTFSHAGVDQYAYKAV